MVESKHGQTNRPNWFQPDDVHDELTRLNFRRVAIRDVRERPPRSTGDPFRMGLPGPLRLQHSGELHRLVGPARVDRSEPRAQHLLACRFAAATQLVLIRFMRFVFRATSAAIQQRPVKPRAELRLSQQDGLEERPTGG